MTIDVEKCLVYMLPSIIGVDINVGIAINAKGLDHVVIDVKGLMSKDWVID
jgi:hypothetical protein